MAPLNNLRSFSWEDLVSMLDRVKKDGQDPELEAMLEKVITEKEDRVFKKA